VARARIIGLLASIALVAPAFISAPTPASAAVLCGNSSSPCRAGDGYPVGTELHGALGEGSVIFVGEKNTLKCGSAALTAKTTAAGTPIAAQVTALSFSSCELGCTVSAQNLPYKAEIEYTANDDGVVTLSSGGSGPPRVKNICLGLSCTFGAAKITLDLEGGAPAAIKASSEPLVREAGEKSICGDTAQWSSAYRVSEPMALFAATREVNPISLCAVDESPCPEGKTYPIGSQLQGGLAEGTATFVGEKGPLKCGAASIAAKTTAAGTPIAAQVTALSFSSCELGCTVSAQNLPYKAEIEYTANDDGVVTLSSGGSGPPRVKNICLGLSCTFGAAKITLDLEGGAPAAIKASSEPLVREAGEKSICGDTAQWSSAYQATEPMALFVEPAGRRKLYFGISANTRSDGTAAQDQAAETGADRLREDLEWAAVEPSDDNWQWGSTDTLFETAAERELRILPILNTSPCWAVPEKAKKEEQCETSYPVSDAEYAEFTAQVAARYGPSGDFWDAHPELEASLAPRYFEIWNEPYIESFVNGEVDPARYATLYKAAVIAGRAANPSSRYLVESTADKIVNGTQVNWAAAMVKTEPSIGSYVDGIAIHPYPDERDPFYQPTSALSAAFKKTDRIYSDWVGQGIRRPIWITEVGYSSCGEDEDCVFGETQANRETLKAQWISDMLEQLGTEEYSYVHSAYLYNLRQWEDPETLGNASDWYGILDKDGEELPAWSSFAEAVEDFDGIPTGHALILGKSIAGANATFTFALTDPTATASCQLDAGGWTACSSPHSYFGLSGGSHTFRVRASNAEATEAVPATYSW
jgi:hypothetical protein